jgi:hypothetical protein
MIEINKLTKKDIDRWVSYIKNPNNEEVGAISSWNDKFIFVKYISGQGGLDNGVATEPEDLRFLTEEEEDELPEFLNALEERRLDDEEE